MEKRINTVPSLALEIHTHTSNLLEQYCQGLNWNTNRAVYVYLERNVCNKVRGVAYN